MIYYDDITKENITKHNGNWMQIPDHLYRIWIIWGSGSRQRNALLNLISQQLDTDNIYLHKKDPYEPK